MSLKYSRNSIRFLEVACLLGTVLGITPRYDFDKNCISGRKLYKCYCLIIGVVSLVMLIWCLHIILFGDEVDYSPTVAVLLFLHVCVVMALIVVTSLGSAFWNMDKWKELIESFLLLEKYFNMGYKVEESFIKNFYFQFFLFHLLIASTLTFSLALWYQGSNFTFTTNVGLSAYISFLIYVKAVRATMVFNIVLAIKCKYQNLNDYFLKGCSKKPRDMLRTLRTVSYLHGLMNELVRAFNQLIGWEVLLGLLHSSVMILSCFSLVLMTYSDKENLYDRTSTGIIISFVSFGITSVVGPLEVIFSCDGAITEARKIVAICYKYQQQFPAYSEEKQELTHLLNLVINDRPAFTAAGFFEIDRRTLLGLLATTTTYFIVLIQFN